MLVKVNGIYDDNKTINVTKLDIDDYGSVVPLEELVLQLPSNSDSTIDTLRNSQYAVISIQGNLEANSSIIISADSMTLDELNNEKKKTIESSTDKKEES
jgi:hypothetical protein